MVRVKPDATDLAVAEAETKAEYTRLQEASVAVRRGVALVLVLIVMAVAVSATGLLFMGLAVGRPAQISSNSTLLLDISGDLAEMEPVGLGQFLDGQPTVRSVVDALRKASVDRRVSSVIIRPTGTAALWGKVQEVRDAITEFRKSKKPIVAHLETASDQSYYLASACDKIFLTPTASLDLAYQLEVSSLLTRLNRDRAVTMVLATHDLNLAASVCDRLVLMRAGEILAHGATADVLTQASINQLYNVEADVQFHEMAGHLTVVPIRRIL